MVQIMHQLKIMFLLIMWSSANQVADIFKFFTSGSWWIKELLTIICHKGIVLTLTSLDNIIVKI